MKRQQDAGLVRDKILYDSVLGFNKRLQELNHVDGVDTRNATPGMS
jgi:hypothetical protein